MSNDLWGKTLMSALTMLLVGAAMAISPNRFSQKMGETVFLVAMWVGVVAVLGVIWT